MDLSDYVEFMNAMYPQVMGAFYKERRPVDCPEGLFGIPGTETLGETSKEVWVSRRGEAAEELQAGEIKMVAIDGEALPVQQIHLGMEPFRLSPQYAAAHRTRLIENYGVAPNHIHLCGRRAGGSWELLDDEVAEKLYQEAGTGQFAQMRD